jgi:hypothetical protein
LAPAEDGHDDPEADHDLGRGHHQHEEHGDLTAEVVELAVTSAAATTSTKNTAI